MKLLMVLLGSPSEFPYGSQGPRVLTLLSCSLQGRHTGMYERHIAPDWSSSGRGSVRTRRANHRLISGKTLFLFQHLRPADRPRQQSKMEELQNKTLFGFIYLFLRSFFVLHYTKQANLTTGVFGIIMGMWLRAAQMKLLHKGEH